jgi:hypothetical protein
MAIPYIDKIITRPALYFGKYQYCLNFYLPEASLLRGLNVRSIRTRVEWLNCIRPNILAVSPADVKNIIKVCNEIRSFKSNYKLTVSSNRAYFYTNDLEDIDTLSSRYSKISHTITQIQVEGDKNIILLKNPKHKYRSYFRDRFIIDDNSLILREFLLKRNDVFFINRGLLRRYTKDVGYRCYLFRTDYIEYDNSDDIKLLDWVIPNLIRKTFPIKAK